MKRLLITATALCLGAGWAVAMENPSLAKKILADERLTDVKERATAIIRTGFNAGDGYSEVWIRDFNTFIELACAVRKPEEVREKLLLFFHFQGDDGNIVDGLTDASKAGVGYDYIRAASQPGYVAHKNTVETDQESSLVLAVCRYARLTGDRDIFSAEVVGRGVAQRLDDALTFVMTKRFDVKHGLIWGATTADWGDVQPEHAWGVELNEDTHRAIDIYDNALFLAALDELLAADVLAEDRRTHWNGVRRELAANVRKHLWDSKREKFIPHVYVGDSPFPEDFDENAIYYHGGTAVAIEANLLNRDEVAAALGKMRDNVKAAGAATIGLTMYPAYPEGFFKNPILTKPYTYQNGGDWTWFGGRMIRQLIRNGLIEEAYAELSPMLDRVVKNNGFYEWYTITNEPHGSGTYRGSAGVLYAAIEELRAWAEAQKS